MAWLRLGDTAATYPKLLECGDHPDADDSTVNLVFGWFLRIAAEAARHPHATDYIVKMATARLIGGGRAATDQLIAFAMFGGLLTVVEIDERPVLRLLNDPEFVHIKTGEVLDFEKQRRSDNGKPEITVLVRVRDGDACRYCGRVVNFLARTGKLAGTYDHRPPGQPADAERSVVACSSCNATRKDLPLDVADELVPLLDPPRRTYYSISTRKWLHGHEALLSANGLEPPALADASFRNLAPGTELQHPETAPTRVRPGVAQPATVERPADDGRLSGARQEPDRPGPSQTGRQGDGDRETGTGRAGPGRDGSGRDGTGLDGTGGQARSAEAGPSSSRPRTRRSRRGGRNRNRPAPPQTSLPQHHPEGDPR